jgi:hypothetical protein
MRQELVSLSSRWRSLAVAAALVGLSLVAPATVPAADHPVADAVLLNAKVLTVDARDSVAQAVAIAGGKIAAVGTSEAVRAWIGPKTQVFDLKGLTLTPGLIDSHCHLSTGGAEEHFSLDLRFPTVKSIAEIAKQVGEARKQRKSGEWVQGTGWDEGKLAERRVIVASDLDPATPDNPVWLEQTMGHYGTANAAALKLAGVDRNTPDPAGGTIDRLPDGTPSGLLRENAMGLVTGRIPEPTRCSARRRSPGSCAR